MGKSRLEKKSAQGHTVPGNRWHLGSKNKETPEKEALEKRTQHQADRPSLLSLRSPFCLYVSVLWFATVASRYVLYWTLDSPHWIPGDCPGLHLESLHWFLGQELVLFLSLLALLFPAQSEGFSLRLSQAPPGLGVTHSSYGPQIGLDLSLPESRAPSPQIHYFPGLVLPCRKER